MIADAATVDNGATLTADLVVVGSGPAGIAVALEVATAGYHVLLVESGRETFSREIQKLADAAEWDRDLHAPMSLTNRRQVGGASVIWGGRCVPYDPVDFDRRAFVGEEWPVSYTELLPYFQRACDWLACGRAVFDATVIDDLPKTLVPGLVDGEVRTSTLERWSVPMNFGKHYERRLRASDRVRLVTGLTCTQIVCRQGESRVDRLECRTLEGKRIAVRARAYVVACGGLESTRLLLASPGPADTAIGNHSDHLGRWYMAHVEGVVANVRFRTPPHATLYGYERDVDGVYVRRRFSFTREFQREHELPNIAAWLANPDLADARHRNGGLSFAYLALASPLGPLFAPEAQRRSLTGEAIPGAPYGAAEKSPLRQHVANMIRDGGSTSRFVLHFGMRRFLSRQRRVPGFFAYSPSNVYPLQYHAEHMPNRESRATLASERDALGMPKLKLDLRFTDQDVNGVARSHQHWDHYLRRTGCGHLEFVHDDLQAAIWDRIGGGFHQVGTTRISARAEDGVVDPDLAVHGVGNLFVASSSAFVTSSQANSTFMIMVFAVRLAEHLRTVLQSL
jgi:choline dehydrogenase-like flavoprotein